MMQRVEPTKLCNDNVNESKEKGANIYSSKEDENSNVESTVITQYNHVITHGLTSKKKRETLNQ